MLPCFEQFRYWTPAWSLKRTERWITLSLNVLYFCSFHGVEKWERHNKTSKDISMTCGFRFIGPVQLSRRYTISHLCLCTWSYFSTASSGCSKDCSLIHDCSVFSFHCGDFFFLRIWKSFCVQKTSIKISVTVKSYICANDSL